MRSVGKDELGAISVEGREESEQILSERLSAALVASLGLQYQCHSLCQECRHRILTSFRIDKARLHAEREFDPPSLASVPVRRRYCCRFSARSYGIVSASLALAGNVDAVGWGGHARDGDCLVYWHLIQHEKGGEAASNFAVKRDSIPLHKILSAPDSTK